MPIRNPLLEVLKLLVNVYVKKDKRTANIIMLI